MAKKKVIAIVPVFNEARERNYPLVLRALTKAKKERIIDGFVVVNDGSTDRSERIARKHKAEVIGYPDNRGKGSAVLIGLEHAKKAGADIAVLLDADLENLCSAHIQQLVEPVATGKTVMAVGNPREAGKFPLDITNSGERALDLSDKYFGGWIERKQWSDFLQTSRFGVELALNYFAEQMTRKNYAQRHRLINFSPPLNSALPYRKSRNADDIQFREIDRAKDFISARIEKVKAWKHKQAKKRHEARLKEYEARAGKGHIK